MSSRHTSCARSRATRYPRNAGAGPVLMMRRPAPRAAPPDCPVGAGPEPVGFPPSILEVACTSVHSSSIFCSATCTR